MQSGEGLLGDHLGNEIELATLPGIAVGPITLPSGEQIAVCDDPQGAAFAMRGRATRG
jgi:hypothetical protein